VSGPQNGLYLPQSKYGSGSPILRIEDYQLDWSKPSGELKCVAATPGDRECYSLRKDDIVINRVNSPSHLGKALLVQDSNLPALFESNMMRISLVSSAAPPYVTLFLQSMLGRQLLTKNAKWAVNQASINQTDVKSTPIPLPPADEQLEIVRRAQELLTRAGHLVPVIDGAAMRLHRSDQATLGKAFRGELIPTGAEQELAEGAA
jgi:type I restriction enzyme S subunit